MEGSIHIGKEWLMIKKLSAKRDCRGMDNDEIIEATLEDRGIEDLDEFLRQLDLARMVIVFAASGIVRDVRDGLGKVTRVGMMALEKQHAVDVENGLRIQVF